MVAKVLEAQIAVQQLGPPEVKDLELLTLEDLEEIRRIWLEEKHEAEDTIPKIYEQVMKKPYPGKKRAHHPILNTNVLDKLKAHCTAQGDEDGLLYQQMRAVMSIANKHRNQLRRAKLSDELAKSLDKGAFNNLFEAKQFALERERHRLQIKINNSPDLEQDEKDDAEEKIIMITRSIKEEGYSSLNIEFEEITDDT
jgi:DNA sulfur modification protein DndC